MVTFSNPGWNLFLSQRIQSVHMPFDVPLRGMIKSTKELPYE
jgi:hypothetical protein